jgi:recombinational DNA repair protein (RecF pathway)
VLDGLFLRHVDGPNMDGIEGLMTPQFLRAMADALQRQMKWNEDVDPEFYQDAIDALRDLADEVSDEL